MPRNRSQADSRIVEFEQSMSECFSKFERQVGEAVRVGQVATEALEVHRESAQERDKVLSPLMGPYVWMIVNGLS